MQNRLLRTAIYLAMGASLAAALPYTAQAASGDGSLVGRLTDSENRPLADAEVTARNPETGFTRTVKADASGNYRFPFLPVGNYVIEATKDGKILGKLADVTVGLGTATTANVTVSLTSVEEIQVLGSRIVTAVDVRSVESATNLTRVDLERLPVDRNVTSVALLAPGLTQGDTALGGISFGGSSVAENTIYINGLNVTDFYNRIGFSSVPYAFYKEFQVKTGGYSVEFGRTTGGVINAVTRSGTNEFEFGTEIAWEPKWLQSSKTDRYYPNGDARIIGRYDEYENRSATVYASGPIVRDKLFFFALYEARDYNPVNTSNSGTTFFDATEDNGFWGAKIDWQINDRNLLELLAFSDENDRKSDSYAFNWRTGERGNYQNTQFTDNGGLNWAATFTTYLTDTFSAKVLYGENERKASSYGANDPFCSRIRDMRPGQGSADLGCTTSSGVTSRTDTREAIRLDFEWVLGAHQLRFGLDHETNTSEQDQHYAGPDQLWYDVYRASLPTLDNDYPIAVGTDYVRTRAYGVSGEFETINRAFYLEDNWSILPNLHLNLGVRVEAFDNKNSAGDSYIKMDDMVAPRLGFSWDPWGQDRAKVFGNVGRYFLPVANVINIKQAGGLLDERTFYEFLGFEPFTHNGQTYQRPILGAQLGPVDNSQGDGTVGDLRGEVDADMDPVYQDEVILGFQSMIDDKWSWGVRGIYRRLHNAIDDMEIRSNGIYCDGSPTYVGWVMANPGEPVTVFTDTNCDDVADAYVTIDTSKEGWTYAGQTYEGEVGYPKPKRDYKALELMIDRGWDGNWSLNAVYTLSWSKGNAEGPVNSDTNFGDAGRTEAFDNPWVNYGSYGYLANDRRHQLKLRGAYALTENWSIGTRLTVQSGRPKNARGGRNPFDSRTYSYNSFFIYNNETGEFELRPRGSQGRTPWIYDLGLNVTYQQSFSFADLSVKLAVYNVLNSQRVTEIDERLGSINPNGNADYGIGTSYQSPRYGLLTFSLTF
jgi:hypothetical protein